ncbi:putative disease resistance RPP13-like protein 1 [Morella rubra]|uniref:Putative disease resistance RPP13-like protein 1 n=1 Tax=Morella rubra TaxID=262757 RepID=A0A6A1WR21_9ROSI|nr:putative disease resistance RPP13-like protein 1 [Morella rubra]
MAEVGGALLSAFLQVVIDRAASREVLDFLRGHKLIGGLVNKLKIALMAVNVLVEDAEEKQATKPNVKTWLDELKDAVYDAEDILDKVATQALRRKLDAEFETTAIKVRNRTYASLSLYKLRGKIEEVHDRLKSLAEQKDVIGLREGVTGRPSERLPTTSLVEESGIFGRDDDKEEIIKGLLSEDKSGNEVGVIAIVGMGGMGKTTLAQRVYNDERVKKHFDLEAWVCVSEDFDLFKVTKTILEAVTSARPELEEVGRQIAKKCEGLPLAAKAIGAMLRPKANVDEWERILNSELWNLSIEETKILPALREMLNWETWFPFGAENEDVAFPSLEELYIKKCPKLKVGFSIDLPSLAKLEIDECPQLVISLRRAPAIRELELMSCNEVLLKELPVGMQRLRVGGFDSVESLPEGLLDSNSCLQELEISDCSSLVSLPTGGLSSTLKNLKLEVYEV